MNNEEMRVEIITREDGRHDGGDNRIIGWYEVDEGGYLLPKEELSRFSACSGNLYKVEGDALVFDETLDVITVETPPTGAERIDALEEAVAELAGEIYG